MHETAVINLLKGLVIDGVHKAKSGHPGGAMSSMDFAYILFAEYLQFDPDNPRWLGRDRFILSAGHESMLQYALLHGIGWLAKEELRRFRQWNSLTPGHPENLLTPGVECTTGPLGQGAAMSVGFALAAVHHGACIDKGLFANRTWVILGDGCMQEDVTLGAASLAGHLKLDKLLWYYDKNAQQISGPISRATSDDETQIFAGFGWHVQTIDGHDHGAIRGAIAAAQAETSRPSLIVGKTIMAQGAATMEGSHDTHGAPLPGEERLRTRAKLGLPANEDFYWPEGATTKLQGNFTHLRKIVAGWHQHLAHLQAKSPEIARRFAQQFSPLEVSALAEYPWNRDKPLATRQAFGELLAHWAPHLPQLMGGSADLEPSNMTGKFARLVGEFSAASPEGRNISFGVREFPMAAICNGMSLYGGLKPFAATFLSFADYMRPAFRLGAIQHSPVIYEFTHDSFYLGEDGPTHQPIEHLMSLRGIPGFRVYRPADPFETELVFRQALGCDSPSALCLTRQAVPYLGVSAEKRQGALRGAWSVQEHPAPELIIFASGSEVGTTLKAIALLENRAPALPIRLVSVPCWEVFFSQDTAYQEEILAWQCPKRVAVEAGISLGWEKFVGPQGLIIGIDHYGASAPAEDLAQHFGFTPEALYQRILTYLG